MRLGNLLFAQIDLGFILQTTRGKLSLCIYVAHTPESFQRLAGSELSGPARPKKNMTFHLAWPLHAAAAASNMAAAASEQLISIRLTWREAHLPLHRQLIEGRFSNLELWTALNLMIHT